MDIAYLSMVLSQVNVQQQASLSVMKKSLDQAETNGNGLLKMLHSADVAAIQRASQPHLGQNIDLKL